MNFKEKIKKISEKTSSLNEINEEENNNFSRNILYVHMPNSPEGIFTPVGFDQIKIKYEDEVGARLFIIVDEVAELLQQSGLKSEAGKAEDAIKQEIQMLIQSITQLGRSAGINMVLATQRNDTSIINGIIQNNSLDLNTKLLVKRDV